MSCCPARGTCHGDGDPRPCLVFGNNVDTDVMAPWNTLALPWEERRKAVLAVRPEFVERVQPGDVIVAGRNWGCGSSREQAPENLQLLGVAAVVAESFGRIYFRNCVAIAFPISPAPASTPRAPMVTSWRSTCAAGACTTLRVALCWQAHRYAPDMLAILDAGGLLEV